MTLPHHKNLRLQNFTTFADTTFEFSPTINVLVGENGTGKTHLMKVLYSIQYMQTVGRDQAYDKLENIMASVFQFPIIARIPQPSALVRQGAEEDISKVIGEWNEELWAFNIIELGSFGHSVLPDGSVPWPEMSRAVFIPAIDMMGHTRRFVSTYDEYQIDFDQTHRDIVALLLAPERRQPTQNPEIADLLASLLGGEVEEEGERFYLKTPRGRQPMPLVAEGLRKIATLYQLIRNGFLEPGSVLFWDEPEVNVNPKLMDELVDVLLRLARSGVQIFLATHSYIILKELDLQAHPSDTVRYFGMERTENGTVAHATDDYSQLQPNPISDQFDSLYDRELDRSVGKRRRA